MNSYLSDIELKQELLNILKATGAFLDDHNLKYSILYGTLLGAIRHKGFIPWDDDIDIAMPRDSYNELVRILNNNKKITGSIEGVGYEVGETHFPFLKIVNRDIKIDGTGAVETENLWIDIFPIDGVPNHFRKIYYFYLLRVVFKNYVIKRMIFYRIRNQEKQTLADKIARKVLVNMRIDKDIDRLIKVASKYPIANSELIANNVWGLGLREAFPKEVFDEMVDYPFEDILIKGIKDTETYLRGRYGDYMKLPPENERYNHGIKAYRI